MLTSLAVFAIMFAAILQVMPDVQLGWSDVWAAGLFIALLFVIGKFLIAIGLHGARWKDQRPGCRGIARADSDVDLLFRARLSARR